MWVYPFVCTPTIQTSHMHATGLIAVVEVEYSTALVGRVGALRTRRVVKQVGVCAEGVANMSCCCHTCTHIMQLQPENDAAASENSSSNSGSGMHAVCRDGLRPS